MPPIEEQDPHINIANCFSDLPMVEEEEETQDVFYLQHSYNTRSKCLTSQDNSPSTCSPKTSKTVPPKQVIPKLSI